MLRVRSTEGKAIGNELSDERRAALVEIVLLAVADSSADAQISGLLATLGDAAAALPEVARHHKVTPAVYRAVRHSAALSPETVGPLRQAYDEQILRHLSAAADLAFVARTLNAAGIRWLAMKGPVLADCVWPRPDMREYYDLDVLVDRRTFGPALQSLCDAGAVLVDRNWPMIEWQRRAELTLTLPYGSFLDLHWDVVNERHIRSQLGVPVSDMLVRSSSVRIGDEQIPTFDAPDTVLSLIVHAGLSGANRLVWLKDIQYAAAFAEWDEVLRRMDSMRLGLMFSAVVSRVRRALNADLAFPQCGAWLRLTQFADSRWPVPRLPEQPHTGQAVYRSTRRTTSESALALTRDVFHLRRKWAEESPGNPLHLDRPDSAARSRYLAVVESDPRP